MNYQKTSSKDGNGLEIGRLGEMAYFSYSHFGFYRNKVSSQMHTHIHIHTQNTERGSLARQGERKVKRVSLYYFSGFLTVFFSNTYFLFS